MRTIVMKNSGNVGNRMFQYLFCRMIQFQIPDSILVGYDLPMWNLVTEPAKLQNSGPVLQLNGGHSFDMDEIVSFLKSHPEARLEFGGYAQRLEYYGSPDLMRSFFQIPKNTKRTAIDADSLLIHVRAADALDGSVHADYMPMPISFYERLMAAVRLKPVFIGQLSANWYTDELKRRFAGATFLEQSNPIEDFSTIFLAQRIVTSVSTFAWLAAWLSPTAVNIHLSKLGFLNPLQRPDIDLLPRQDNRYVFHEFPVRKWTGSKQDIEYVLA